MTKITSQFIVLNKDNKEVKKLPVPKAIIEAKANPQLLFDCAQAYLANRRQGTRKAKTRGEVQGSTAKIYRQKGTGQARHGDIKASIFVGGGQAFPPKPQDWRIQIPKQARRKALATALSLRHREGQLLVVDQLIVGKIKTKVMAALLRRWKVERGLVVIDQPDEKVWRSIRNIPNITLTTVAGINALDVLSHPKILFTEQALAGLEKRLATCA